MTKLNFEEVLEKISDGGFIKRSEVLASALNRKIWVSEWHIPGCLSESQCYCTTKRDAISSACAMAENENGIPRGIKTALQKYGRFDCHTEMFGDVINTVSQIYISDLF